MYPAKSAIEHKALVEKIFVQKKIVPWCSDNTGVFGTSIPGLNPGGTTKRGN